jgi:peptidoglycan/xylan/chitin deacetylase (PgdA/CDA1 family)
MYHRLADHPSDPEEGDYVLPVELFARQLDLLASENRPVFLPSASATAAPGGSVVLTFDDGCDSDVREALPLLRAHGFRAAFFVNPGRLGRPGYLTWPQVIALAEAGMAVGSHGLDHRLLDDLPDDELLRDLAVSKEALEQHLGRGVEWLSLPGGSGGIRAWRAARGLGYKMVFGSAPGLLDARRPPPIVPRWPVRRGLGLEGFRAIVERRPSIRLRAGLRFAATHVARRAMGTARYERLRRVWLGGGGPAGGQG